jgi:flagellar hook-length control protein FliK
VVATVGAPAVAAPIAAAPASAAPAATPVPLATQLSRPLFTLATAPTGEHTIVVSVAPDNLGPVTVRAQVSADGMRVELFAPTDVGRDAIRAILPDLRKDIAGSGLNSNLTLSSQNQPTDGGGGGTARERFAPESPRQRESTPTTTDQTPASPRGNHGTSTTIDVMV